MFLMCLSQNCVEMSSGVCGSAGSGGQLTKMRPLAAGPARTPLSGE